jgi:hypothetical protein
MSKYSFIEAELNTPGKQCFCIDINSSNTPFTYASQITSTPTPTPSTSIPTTSIPTTSIPTPSTPTTPNEIISETNLLNNNLFNLNNSYLLSPDSKATSGDREKQIIQTVNSLLTSAVNEITDQSNSNTVNNYKDDDIDDTNVDDLNKMANRGNKKYKSKSKSLNFLQENFEQDKCNNTCSIKKSYKKNKSLLNSDNMIVILLLIVIAYLFYNKK